MRVGGVRQSFLSSALRVTRPYSLNMEAARALRRRRKAATDMGVMAGRPVLAGVAGTNALGAVLGVPGSSGCPKGSPVPSAGSVWLPASCFPGSSAKLTLRRSFRLSPSGRRDGVARLRAGQPPASGVRRFS